MKFFLLLKNTYLQIFLLHFCIAFSYLFFIDWSFVTYENPDPIGMGIKLWLCFGSHLLITLLLLGVIGAIPKTSNFITGRVVVINIASIVLVIIVYLFLDSLVLMNILWALRSK